MARKPASTTVDIAPVTLEEGRALTEIRQEANTAILADAAADEQRDIALVIGKRLGRRMMANAIRSFCNVTDLIDLQTLKDSKKYKGLRHVAEDGKLVTITNWADYCLFVEGKSVEAVDLDLKNLKQLGGEFFEAMRQIGIGPSSMRDIRQLPEDAQQALMVAAEQADKDAFLDLAESLIAKHAAEKSALQKQVDESKADYEALDKNLARHKERADQAERDLDKLKHRVETEPPDEYAAQVREEASVAAFAAEAALMGKLRPAFEALEKHDQEHDCTHENFMSGLLAQVEGAILHLRNRYNVKLVPDADERPDWTREDFDADAVVAAALAKSRQEIGHA